MGMHDIFFGPLQGKTLWTDAKLLFTRSNDPVEILIELDGELEAETSIRESARRGEMNLEVLEFAERQRLALESLKPHLDALAPDWRSDRYFGVVHVIARRDALYKLEQHPSVESITVIGAARPGEKPSPQRLRQLHIDSP